MHKIRDLPRLESLQRSPRPSSCISGGLLLRGGIGRARERKGGGKGKGEEREGKGKEGKKRGRTPPAQIFVRRTARES